MSSRRFDAALDHSGLQVDRGEGRLVQRPFERGREQDSAAREVGLVQAGRRAEVRHVERKLPVALVVWEANNLGAHGIDGRLD